MQGTYGLKSRNNTICSRYLNSIPTVESHCLMEFFKYRSFRFGSKDIDMLSETHERICSLPKIGKRAVALRVYDFDLEDMCRKQGCIWFETHP